MKDIDVQKLGTWPIPRLLISMATPMIVAMIINGTYFLVDAIFVGRGVGTDGLGGLAVVFPLQMLAIALGTMLGVGSGSIISLELGKGNKVKAIKAVKSTIVLSILLGLILPICLILFRGEIIRIMGATESIFSHAEAYYRYIVCGFVFIFLSMIEISTLRAEGKAKIAAIGMIASSLINAALDPLFIFGFHMGTGGAAIATVIARILVTIYLTSFYFRKESVLDLSKENWLPELEISKKVVTLGFGVFLNQLSFSILAIAMNLSLCHYGGSLDISVYGVISRIYIFVTMPFMGLAQGFQPIVGYNLGAKKYSRINKAIKTVVFFSIILGVILLFLFEIFPQAILGLFTSDIQLIKNGIPPLRIAMIMTPIVGIQILSYFFFLAIDRPLKGIFISLSRQSLFILPFILLLPPFLGTTGIWLAYPIADMISVGISYLMMVGEKFTLPANKEGIPTRR